MTISQAGSYPSSKGIKISTVDTKEVLCGTALIKRGFAHMQKHGVVMDVTNVEQAVIAEDAGAVAVMVLDKLPYDVRKAGGVARTASVKVIQEIMDAITIPIMAKCRIGHTDEAKVLEAVGVDMIDESEVLTPADEERHIWKWDFTPPFVNGAKNLGEALRRIEEGCAMIRTKGEPGTGNVSEAVTHIRIVNSEIRRIRSIYQDGDKQERTEWHRVEVFGKTARYIGKAAHAGGAPHMGINALYAANIGLAAINAVRETFRAFVEHGVPFTIATDGPEMMRTHLRDELDLLRRIGALDGEELAEANARGHEASFVNREPVLASRA